MHVPDARFGAAQRGDQGRVVEPGTPQLVEADHDIHRRAAGRLVQVGQIGVELLCGASQLPDPAFEEIPGERRFGHHQEVGRLRVRAQGAEQLADPGQILGKRALPGLELGNGEAEHWE